MKRIAFTALLVLLCILCAAAFADPVMVTLSDTTVTAASGITADGSVVTVTAPGEYILSGSLSNGQIVVNSAKEGKITLYLNGVDIRCENGPAVYVKKAGPRVTISLMENSDNKLSSGKDLVFERDDEPNAAIFSRSDLTITGSGRLTVTAEAYDGISSKDDLRIKDGTITVTAARHGIRGKDAVEISGGVLTVQAGRDGIRSTRTGDSDYGYVAITGGTITITCGDDPLSAITGLTVKDAVIVSTITAE